MIEFPGTALRNPHIGGIWIPTVDIVFMNGNVELSVRMLVDSGAYITIIPLTLGLALGLTDTGQMPRVARGAGGMSVPHREHLVKVRIGRYTIEVRVGWTFDDETPPLLLSPSLQKEASQVI